MSERLMIFGQQTLVGQHETIQKLHHLLQVVAPRLTTVLVTGESGTGKELVARAIHELSPRKDKPFIPVNCGAIPPELLESEIFGHERGAFTGAVGARAGMFQLAHEGTIFLDEIAELSPRLQVKLLRVLEDRYVRPVGSDRVVKVDARVIAATNKDLQREVDGGRFREDLFYRLQVIPIVMPPLRERRTDIPLLIAHFLQKYTRQGPDHPVQITDEAMTRLFNYDWPGNVRELENLVQRMVILSRDGWIRPKDLPETVRRGSARNKAVDLAVDMLTSKLGNVEEADSALLRGGVESLFRELEKSVQLTDAAAAPASATGSLKAQVNRAEKIFIEERLAHTRSVAEAARSLGLTRAGLYKKIKKHRILRIHADVAKAGRPSASAPRVGEGRVEFEKMLRSGESRPLGETKEGKNLTERLQEVFLKEAEEAKIRITFPAEVFLKEVDEGDDDEREKPSRH